MIHAHVLFTFTFLYTNQTKRRISKSGINLSVCKSFNVTSTRYKIFAEKWISGRFTWVCRKVHLSISKCVLNAECYRQRWRYTHRKNSIEQPLHHDIQIHIQNVNQWSIHIDWLRKCSREIWLKAIFGLRWNWIISGILNWTELNWTERCEIPHTGITKIEFESPFLWLSLCCRAREWKCCVFSSMCLWKIIFCGKLFLQKFINCIIMNGAVVMIVCLYCLHCVLCVCVLAPLPKR